MATRRILIVDDDVDALRMIGLMLEKRGYEIVAAASGQQALQKAIQTNPHLIILDIMMPGMNGYEVTTRLRQLPSTRAIPIIVFTGKSQPKDKADALNAGANIYLSKPVHPDELIAHIERLLEQPVSMTILQQAELSQLQPGKSIVFLPVKGGIGNSTLALNTAIEFKHMKPEQRVAVVELQDGGGSMAMQAGINVRKGIASLIASPLGNINPETIAAAMANHGSGVDMLLNTPRPRGADFELSATYVRTILGYLDASYDAVFLDVPPNLNEIYTTAIQMAHHIFLTMEASKMGMEMARGFLVKLESLDIERDRINLIVIHRVPAIGTINTPLIEQTLHYDMIGVIPPAADLVYESMQTGRPIVQIQTNGVVTQQIRRVIQAIPKLPAR